MSMAAAVSRFFRSRRMRALVRQLAITARTRVLDVGGTDAIWDLAPVRPRLVLLNMPRAYQGRGQTEEVFADGCRLPFADRSFDLVFSNSVIEHVGDASRQERFAAELRRVARRYWVQTPDRAFPVEPHLLTPLLHYLPHSWQRWLVYRFTVWEWLERPSPDRREFYLQHYLRDIQLLRARDMRRLFPDARLIRERFLGFSKSLIAVGETSAAGGNRP